MRDLLIPRARVTRMDVALATVVSLLAQVALLLDPLATPDAPGISVGLALLTLVMTVPVAWRRVLPLPTLTIAGVAALVGVAAGDLISVGAIAVWALVGSTALHTDRRTSLAVGLAGAAGVGWGVYAGNPPARDLLDLVTAAGVGTLPAFVGDALRRQRELTDEVLRLRGAELESAAREERVRIARDLHDTVGHHLGAIALRARAGELDAADGDTAGAGESLAAVVRLSDRALEDTRVLLGVLRDDDDPQLRPTPRLRDLDELAETAAISGVRVTVRRAGADEDLPDPISTCAYRIVQEALTNTAKHAAPASAQVVVERAEGRLRLTVTDDGHASPPRGSGDGVGHGGLGLTGMRERAHAVGGTVVAGPADRGGWHVHADLPDRL